MMPALHKELKGYIDRQINDGRLRHLYLFTGEEGIGKKTFAKNLAKQLLCGSKSILKPCDACLSCRTFNAGTNADFLLVESDAKNILIEESRRIADELSLKPINSKRKAVVIADAHKLTIQAQNSILKTIEEPPEHAVIIMTCTDKELLLETIVSRAFHFAMKLQDKEIIKDILVSATPFALRYGNGNIGKTKECLVSDFKSKRIKAYHLLKSMIVQDMSGINENDYTEDLENYLMMIITFLRDMLLITINTHNAINVDMERELGELVKVAGYDRIAEIIEKAKRAIGLADSNTNKKIVFGNFVYGN